MWPAMQLLLPAMKLFFVAGNYAQVHDLNVFQTPLTPEECFLSKKGTEEGERVARGHLHERVAETHVHWLTPAV